MGVGGSRIRGYDAGLAIGIERAGRVASEHCEPPATNAIKKLRAIGTCNDCPKLSNKGNYLTVPLISSSWNAWCTEDTPVSRFHRKSSSSAQLNELPETTGGSLPVR